MPTRSIERSLVLVKPDGVVRGQVGNIITRFENAGLKMVGMKILKPSEDRLNQHYADDPVWKKETGQKVIDSKAKQGITIEKNPEGVAEEIRQKLIKGLHDKPVVAIAIAGNDAIRKVRKLAGDTNPIEAAPGTIRGDLASDSYVLADNLERPLYNLVHASDSIANGERELKIWFDEKKIISYDRTSDIIYFNKGE